ncbi:unnamed protein product, partial [Closterium sp. NIES-64]
MAPLHLYCRHCRHQLTAKPLSSFHPMPSPDVDEMAEQWSCDAGSFHPMPSPDVDEMAEQCSFHPMPSPDVDEMAEQCSFHPMPSPDVDEMAEQWSCDAECCADAAARHLTLMFPLWACLSSLPSSSFHPMPSPDVDEMAEQWFCGAECCADAAAHAQHRLALDSGDSLQASPSSLQADSRGRGEAGQPSQRSQQAEGHEAEGYAADGQQLMPNLVPEGGPWEEVT